MAAGDEVDVVLDDAPREVAVPDDLAAALTAVDGARARFGALNYTRAQRRRPRLTSSQISHANGHGLNSISR